MSHDNHPTPDAHSKPDNEKESKSGNGIQSTPEWTRSAIVAIFVIAAVVAGGMDYRATRKAEAAAKIAEQQQASATPQAPVVIGKQRTSYEFDSTGCVEVYLGAHWFSYPIGGKIKFIDIKTGQTVLTEGPGEKHKVSFGNDWYRICAAEPKATGVDIVQ